jgi:para-nitrobenzyl esterase
MKRSIILIFLPAMILLAACNRPEGPVTLVKVEGGRVEGVVENGITIFRGIPFAAPPVGDLRWRPPQPVEPWDTVLKADAFAPACPQARMPFPGAPEMEVSEDCLYLNVWTPASSSKDRLPVMVWIYGGGFAMGSTSVPTYSGEKLAALGVVVVSIAYRVGALGFLAHPQLTAESDHHVSGNYGLLDQIAGLEWVQHNIRAFGGDPGRVTIFGESAGGISVSMLSASPLCKGLFAGAISQSGGSFGPVSQDKRGDGIQLLEGAENTGLEFAARMGAGSIAELREMDPGQWMDDPLSRMGGFWPVVDRYVIAGDQYRLYEAGRYNDVNVLIGTNSDEGSMFVRPSAPAQYEEHIRQQFGPFADRILEAYPGNTESETYTSLADIFREIVFAWPTWSWARLQTRTGDSNVFVYYFSQQQPASLFSSYKPRGAGHGAEVAYVFRHLAGGGDSPYTEEDLALSEMMARYWTNFARTGDPNGEGLPHWPVFQEGGTAVLYMDGTPHTGPVPNLEKLRLMDEYFSWLRERGTGGL